MPLLRVVWRGGNNIRIICCTAHNFRKTSQQNIPAHAACTQCFYTVLLATDFVLWCICYTRSALNLNIVVLIKECLGTEGGVLGAISVLIAET